MFDEIFAVSSLEKVFSDTKPMPYAGRLSMLRKDRLSFQAAFQFLGDRPDLRWGVWVRAEVESPLKQWIRLYHVKEIPSTHPVTDDSDGNYLRTTPRPLPRPAPAPE